MIKNKDYKEQEAVITEETAEMYLRFIRKIISDSIKEYMSKQNIETYKDMTVTAINTVYQSDGKTVDYYTYDVTDIDTDEYYDGLLCRSSDTLAMGDLVRVYFSNIEYIGFKI